MVAAAILALALSPSPQTAASQETDGVGVSLARVRELLTRRAPALKITTPEPTYKVEVIQHPYFTTTPFVWTFAGGGVPIGGGGDEGLGAAVRAIKRKFDERGAREEVSRAIAAFCATHECN